MHRIINSSVLVMVIWLATSSAIAQPPTIGSCTVLPADNIWNTPVDQLPVSPNSSTYVTTIGPTLPVHADFGSGLWDGGPIGIPFATVPGTQTKYPATFQYADESDPGPYAVPLSAPIEGGSQSTGDRHVIAVDINNCVLYELYSAFPQASSWQAGSGAIYNLLSNALRTSSWTSADAAGLPIFPGLLRYDEIAAGEIRHAIRFTVPRTQKAFVWPARHLASSLTDPKYPPMGVRFRLRADFDISGFSPTNQIILKALKKYGMMIADNGSSWYISGAPDSRWDNSDLHNLGRVTGANFEVVDVSPLMVDPNSGQARQTTVSVTVAPSSASVMVNGTKQFSANVANSSDQTVTWAVNGTPGGNSTVGWISAAGLYTAPAVVPSSSITVQATSHALSSAMGTAGVIVTAPAPPISVMVSPGTATAGVGQTKQFGASVQNSSDQTVTWAVNGTLGGNSTVGWISAAGLYTAPVVVPSSSITVQATSHALSSAMGSAGVTITPPAPPISVTISPSTATLGVGQTKQFGASVQNSSDQTVTWAVNGTPGGNSTVGWIGATGLYTAPAVVPLSNVNVQATSHALSSAMGTAGVSITPATPPPPVSVTVSPSTASVGVALTKQFSASVANSSDQTVTWAVNGTAGGNSTVGWISATGLYTAPAVVPVSSITVQATSHAISSAMGTAGVTITAPAPPVSVTISPSTATVRVGKTKQFSASVHSSPNQSVTWKVNGVAGGSAAVGTINASGLYIAPLSIPSPDQVTITAVSAADPAASGSATITVKIFPRMR